MLMKSASPVKIFIQKGTRAFLRQNVTKHSVLREFLTSRSRRTLRYLANIRKQPREVALCKQNMAAESEKNVCAFILNDSKLFNALMDDFEVAQLKSGKAK